jgi:SAM domain (Sterile alpha motif)/Adenylate and Guanylate cyclase catalytic domain
VGGSFNFYLADISLGHAAITGVSRGSTRSSMSFFLTDTAGIPIELRTSRLLDSWDMLLCKTLLGSKEKEDASVLLSRIEGLQCSRLRTGSKRSAWQNTPSLAENGIDISILRHLTDQDLKDIGVLLGHRRKMLAAVAELAVAVPAKPQRAASTGRNPQDSAERRQVTVMFSDLVGSTAVSARMDPEDLREVISAYQKCVSEAVRRFDGFVAKYMGGGVLAYFGYPRPMRTTPNGRYGQAWR